MCRWEIVLLPVSHVETPLHRAACLSSGTHCRALHQVRNEALHSEMSPCDELSLPQMTDVQTLIQQVRREKSPSSA